MTTARESGSFPDLGDDRFKLLARCGKGGAADVFRAEEISLTRPVAIKVLRDHSDEAWSRFDDECKTMGRLSGCGTVVVPFSHGRSVDGRPFLAMEYFEFGSLERKLALGDALSGSQIVHVVADIADALDNAHEAGIFHLDVKPANIFPGSGRNPTKLADFGIAVRAEDARRLGARTELTIEHAAPELLDGRAPGRAADVYALASTTYQMFERRPPFPRRGDDSIEVWIDRIRSEPAPTMASREVSAEVDAIIRRSLDKDPTRRHATAGEFAAALVEAVEAVSPTHSPRPAKAATPPRRESVTFEFEFEPGPSTERSAPQKTRRVDASDTRVPPVPPPSSARSAEWEPPGHSNPFQGSTPPPFEPQVTRVVPPSSSEGPPPVVPPSEQPSGWTPKRIATAGALGVAGLMIVLFGVSVVHKVWSDEASSPSSTTTSAPTTRSTNASAPDPVTTPIDPGAVVTKISETKFTVRWTDTSDGKQPWLVIPVSDAGAAVGGVKATSVPMGSAAPDGSIEVTIETVSGSGCFRVVMAKDVQTAGAPTTCVTG